MESAFRVTTTVAVYVMIGIGAVSAETLSNSSHSRPARGELEAYRKVYETYEAGGRALSYKSPRSRDVRAPRGESSRHGADMSISSTKTRWSSLIRTT
jgi:hypothetical protein